MNSYKWDWQTRSSAGRLRRYSPGYCTENFGPDAVFRNDADGSCPHGKVACGDSSPCCRPAKRTNRDEEDEEDDEEYAQVRTPTTRARYNNTPPTKKNNDERRASFRAQRAARTEAVREQIGVMPVVSASSQFGMKMFTNNNPAPKSTVTTIRKKSKKTKKSKRKSSRRRR